MRYSGMNVMAMHGDVGVLRMVPACIAWIDAEGEKGRGRARGKANKDKQQRRKGKRGVKEDVRDKRRRGGKTD
jgi:hypothetical protein